MNGETSLAEDPPDGRLQLQPCLVCGRTFLPEPLKRHSRICAKLSTKRRRVFDSSKQRAVEGTGPAANSGSDKLSARNQTWKEKHQQLIKSIRSARRAAAETKPSSAAIPSDYRQCPGCERYFSPRVADNHISWCRSKLARIPPSPQPGSSEALERLRARTQYKPPVPASTLTRRSSRSAALSRPTRQPTPRMVHSSPAELESYFSPHRPQQQHTKKASHPPPPRRAPVKFKERFPNHSATPVSGRDYDPYHQADLQMKSLMESASPTGPKTVPGKRVPPGQLYHNNWAASPKDKLENEINLLQLRISTLSSDESLLAAGDAGSPSSLTKNDANNNKPFVSSGQYNGNSGGGCILPDVTAARHYSNRSSERLPHFCHQCGTRYPLLTAKFCCECGYRRQGAQIS